MTKHSKRVPTHCPVCEAPLYMKVRVEAVPGAVRKTRNRIRARWAN